MMVERRRMVRRALSGGIMLAMAGALFLGLLEILYALLWCRPPLESVKEAAELVLHVMLVFLSAAAVVGGPAGLLVLGVSQLTSVLARRRIAEPRWMAWIYSFLSLPGIALVAAKVFAGRRAQQIPGKDYLALGLGIVALLATYGLFRLIIACRDRFRIRRWGPWQALALVPALLLAAVGLYVADQRILPRLYPFFHIGLTVGVVGLCQLAAGTLYIAFRPTQRWIGGLAEPRVALMVLLVVVTAGAWSLGHIGRRESLRFLLYEHTAVQARILSLATALGLARTTPARPASGIPLPPPVRTTPRITGPRLQDRSIILFTVDALRADHAGFHGYSRRTTPNLDRWASRAAILERAYCQVPHTSFSVTSLMTGSYIYSLSRAGHTRRHRTIAEVMRRYGYKTAAFFPPAVFYIDRHAFSAFEESRFGFEYVKYEHLDAEKRVDQALAFLREHEGRKVFAWLHFFEAHEPYELHRPFDFGPRAVDRYDSEIAYVDHHLGRLLSYLKQRWPRAITALTADHGEEFGEHGGHYHGNALWEQQIRVPLVINLPGLKGRRIDGAAETIDLPVTLLSLVDLPTPASMRGTDLGPWLAGESPSSLPPAFCEMEEKKMVARGRYKLVCDTSRDFCALYDLKVDPGETRNLTSRRPELAQNLQHELSAWMADTTQSPSPKERQSRQIATVSLLQRGRRGDAGAVPGLLQLLHGPQEEKREAASILARMRLEQARSALVQASHDPDSGISIVATVGAALLGDPAALGKLDTILKRPDLPPPLRRDALLALTGAGDRSATLPLAAFLGSSHTSVYDRLEIIKALGKLGDPAAAPALLEQLRSLRTRHQSIRALGLVRARPAVPALIQSLGEDRFISWRRDAARALGRIGDVRAVGPLRQAVLHDVEETVVAEALEALGRLEGLPVPGTQVLTPSPWRCAKGICSVDLGVSCAAAHTRNLLLVVTRPGGRTADQVLPDEDAPDAPAGPAVSVLCGSDERGPLAFHRPCCGLLQLPPALGGQLRLKAESPPPSLTFAALRYTPVSAPAGH